MIRYLVIIEKTSTGYSAYSPDLPGCIATGNTRKEIKQNIREAIQLHLEGLQQENYEIPSPANQVAYIQIAA